MAMPPQPGPDLSWIVVSHQSGADLPDLLRSLVPELAALRRRGFRSELIVVDNASTDRSADWARALVPWARRVVNPENKGYGAAINQALELARGPWAVIGNSDLVVPPGALDGLPALLASQPDDVAVVGPAIQDGDGRPALSAGRFPTLRTLLTGLFRACDRRKYLDERHHRPGGVDWVTGACFFARTERLRAAGGFDPGFFLYYEDVDLARRLRAAGQRTVFDDRVSVVHTRPHHGRPPVRSIEEVVRSSRRRYFEQHRPAWERWMLDLLARVEPLLRRRTPAWTPPAAAPAGVRVLSDAEARAVALPDPAGTAPRAPAERLAEPAPRRSAAAQAAALAVAEDPPSSADDLRVSAV